MKNKIYFGLSFLLGLSGPARAGHIWPNGGGVAEQNVAFALTSYPEWLGSCGAVPSCDEALNAETRQALAAAWKKLPTELQEAKLENLRPFAGRATISIFGTLRPNSPEARAATLGVDSAALYRGEAKIALSVAEALASLSYSLLGALPNHSPSLENLQTLFATLTAQHLTSSGNHMSSHNELRFFLTDGQKLSVSDGHRSWNLDATLREHSLCGLQNDTYLSGQVLNPAWTMSPVAEKANLAGTSLELVLSNDCQSATHAYRATGTLKLSIYFAVTDDKNIPQLDTSRLLWNQRSTWLLDLHPEALDLHYQDVTLDP